MIAATPEAAAKAAVAVAMAARFELVPLNKIAPSTTEIQRMRRARFNDDNLQELCHSIINLGLQQPIVLRVHPAPHRGLEFEIVAGERRFLAHKLAKLTHIEAKISNLDDEQVLEIQLIENLQREGLHEMEEAEGYHALMKLKEFTADQVAGKIGKSRRYVFNRLALLKLCPEARTAFYADKFEQSVAIQLARIDNHDVQRQAMKALARDTSVDRITARAAQQLISREFMLQLKGAPFDPKVIYLHPEGKKSNSGKPIGTACGKCPKRTGNQPELFEDVTNADTCTDVLCFGAKRDAAQALKVKQFTDQGVAVITGKIAREIKPQHWSNLNGYVEADGYVDHGLSTVGKTWKQLLGKHLPPVQILVDPHEEGKFIEVIPRSALGDALKAAGIKAPKATPERSGPTSEERKSELEIEERTMAMVFEAARKKFKGQLGYPELRLVAQHFVECGDHDPEALEKQWGWKSGQGTYSALMKKIASMPVKDLHQLIFDLMLMPSGGYDDRALVAHATAAKIDIKKIRAKVVADMKAKAAATAKAEAPAKKAAMK